DARLWRAPQDEEPSATPCCGRRQNPPQSRLSSGRPTQRHSMQFVEADGARIPAIGLGVMTLKEETCIKAVDAALRMGYRHVDPAQMYGNERETGEGLRASGVPRGEVFVTTKVWHDRLRAGDFERSVDESLGRLGLSYVDLLLIHWPSKEVPLKETI